MSHACESKWKYTENYTENCTENVKSKYGSSLLTKLSRLLQMKVGRGYSRPNLNNMRKFYLLYPICQTVSDKLTWSHITISQAYDDIEEISGCDTSRCDQWGVIWR